MPSTNSLAHELLDKLYENTIDWVLDKILMEGGVTLVREGAADNIATSKLNVIVYSPNQKFMQYLPVDLKREARTKFLEKPSNTKNRIKGRLSFLPINRFMSNSCNGIIDFRRRLHEWHIVKWPYECATHCLSNDAKEIGKININNIINSVMYISQTVKNISKIRKCFDALCVEKHGRTFALPLDSKTRWSSVDFLHRALKTVSPVIRFIPHALMYEQNKLQIDLIYKLPPEFFTAISDPTCWKLHELS